jgi:hypothetical protein
VIHEIAIAHCVGSFVCAERRKRNSSNGKLAPIDNARAFTGGSAYWGQLDGFNTSTADTSAETGWFGNHPRKPEQTVRIATVACTAAPNRLDPASRSSFTREACTSTTCQNYC